MGIKAVNLNDVIRKLNASVEQMRMEVTMALQTACIQTVANARLLNTYTDRTGNLRSSIGYVVYDKGVKVGEDFKLYPKEEDGSKGMDQAKTLADIVAQEYSNDTVAILVAGMNYAVYVESRGYDVISGPMEEFTSIFESYIKELL